METIRDFKNELLGRREIKIVVPAEKSISFPEAAKIVADSFKSSEEAIAVKEIKGKYGRKTFLISANIYSSKESREATEPKIKVKKAEGAEAK